MTSAEAVLLLRILLKELPGLRQRPAYHKDYLLWEKKIVKVLSEGLGPMYLERFEQYRPGVGAADYDAYLQDLDRKTRLLQEIIKERRSMTAEPPEGFAKERVMNLNSRDVPAPGQAPAPCQPPAVSMDTGPEEIAKPLDPPAAGPEPLAEAQAEIKAEINEEKPPTGAPKGQEQPLLAAEAEAKEKIAETERLLEKTRQALEKHRTRLAALNHLKEMLEAEGESLEEMAAEIFAGLGLEVGSGEGEGLYVRVAGAAVPLEAVAAPGVVPERALRRLIARLADEPPQGFKTRGILLGSALHDTPLQERLSGDTPFFENKLVEQAAIFEICLLSLKDLCSVFAASETPDVAETRARILTAGGGATCQFPAPMSLGDNRPT
ncbi:MAG: hypothetical protein V2A77_06235 [Pseudomonadota bacterium]